MRPPGCSAPNHPTAHAGSGTRCVVCWAQCNTKISFVRLSLRILRWHRQGTEPSTAPCATVQAAPPRSLLPRLPSRCCSHVSLFYRSCPSVHSLRRGHSRHTCPLDDRLSDRWTTFPQWNVKSVLAAPLRVQSVARTSEPLQYLTVA